MNIMYVQLHKVRLDLSCALEQCMHVCSQPSHCFIYLSKCDHPCKVFKCLSGRAECLHTAIVTAVNMVYGLQLLVVRG